MPFSVKAFIQLNGKRNPRWWRKQVLRRIVINKYTCCKVTIYCFSFACRHCSHILWLYLPCASAFSTFRSFTEYWKSMKMVKPKNNITCKINCEVFSTNEIKISKLICIELYMKYVFYEWTFRHLENSWKINRLLIEMKSTETVKRRWKQV